MHSHVAARLQVGSGNLCMGGHGWGFSCRSSSYACTVYSPPPMCKLLMPACLIRAHVQAHEQSSVLWGISCTALRVCLWVMPARRVLDALCVPAAELLYLHSSQHDMFKGVYQASTCSLLSLSRPSPRECYPPPTIHRTAVAAAEAALAFAQSGS